MTRPVTVGYDDSECSQIALDFAAEEARLRNRRLHIVHAFALPLVTAPHDMAAISSIADHLRDEAQQLVDAAVERTRGQHPELTVTGQIADGITVGAVLLEKSADSEVMVLGSRGRGGFTGLLLGSTSSQLASHADCPIIVVRSDHSHEGPYRGQVVVGVDGSRFSQPALKFAFEEASVRRATLVAVYAWHSPISEGPGDMLPLVFDPDELVKEESRIFAEAMAGWQEQYPDVTIERRLERGKPRQVLLELSQGAAVVVIGSRGHGAFKGLFLGSVSQALLHHAKAPVAVIR